MMIIIKIDYVDFMNVIEKIFKNTHHHHHHNDYIFFQIRLFNFNFFLLLEKQKLHLVKWPIIIINDVKTNILTNFDDDDDMCYVFN